MNERINILIKVGLENLIDMTKKQLLKFIESRVLSSHFKNVLIAEVNEYILSVTSKHSSININGDGEINSLFTKDNLVSLFRNYLDSIIFEWELEYILNFIQFNFEFENEEVEDIIFSFSDPYLNFEINENNISNAIKSMEVQFSKPKFVGKTKGSILRSKYRHI